MIDSVSRNKVIVILFAVLILAGILRFYKIEQIPVSLYWDEVSSAYNAYSIALTGRDEFGKTAPLLFRAFEDYKTPANIYLTAVAVKIFGLNEFSARFTSALLGTFTVLASFLLVKELLKKKIFEIDGDHLALLTSVLLAISPWHIQFSRTGFEANSGLFFVILGAFLFMKFINSGFSKYLFSSMGVFAMSIYFYRSIWVFVPLLLTALFLIYYKELFDKKNLKKTLLGILFFSILILPFIPVMFSKQGLVRANQVIIVNNAAEKVLQSAKKQQEFRGEAGKIIYNRRFVYLIESGKGYLEHFSLKFLFFEGDGNGRHGVKGTGVLYAWALLFAIPGLIALFKSDRRIILTVLAWILIAPIPAAVSVPTPHALRSLNMIPMPQLLIALGIVWVYFYIGKKYRTVFSAFIIGMIAYFLVSYLILYFGENAKKTSGEWADGYKQLTGYVFENEKNYDKVLISGHYWQPYIYFLFYKKYDPGSFQNAGGKSSFDKYIFGGTSWDMEGRELGDQNLERLAGTKNFLVALSPVEYNLQKNNINVVKEIKNHNNELVFIIGTNK